MIKGHRSIGTRLQFKVNSKVEPEVHSGRWADKALEDLMSTIERDRPLDPDLARQSLNTVFLLLIVTIGNRWRPLKSRG
jgi:hypothetical protein